MRNIGRCDARYNLGGLQKYQEKGYQAITQEQARR
jgi:hypothetical protein